MKKLLTILIGVFVTIATCNVTIQADNCNIRIGYDDRGGNAYVKVNDTTLLNGEDGNAVTLGDDLVFTFSCNEDGFDMLDVLADIRAYKTGTEEPFYVASTYDDDQAIDKKTISVDNGVGKITISKEKLQEAECIEIDFWWNDFERFGPEDGQFSLMTNCTTNDVDITFSSDPLSFKESKDGMTRKYIFDKLSGDNKLEVIISPKENDRISRLNFNEDVCPNDSGEWGPFEPIEDGKFKLILDKDCQGNQFIEIDSCSEISSDLIINEDITLSEYGDYGLVVVDVGKTLTIDTWVDVRDLIIKENAKVIIKGGPAEDSCHGIHVKYDGEFEDDQGNKIVIGSIQIENGGALTYEEGTSGGFYALELDSRTWFNGIQINGKDGQAVSNPISSHYICIYNSSNTWDVLDEKNDDPQPKTFEELFETFKNEVSNHEWAYAITKEESIDDDTKKDEIKEKLAKEIFNTYIVNESRQERPNSQLGLFDLFMDESDKDLALGSDRLDIDKIKNRYTTFGDFTTKYKNNIANMIKLTDLSSDADGLGIGLKYYEFTFDFDNTNSNGNEFTHKAYVLENGLDFIFAYKVGNTKTFTKFTAGGNGFADTYYMTIPANASDYYSFGNGIGDEGQDLLKDGQTKTYHDALQLGTSASGFFEYYPNDGAKLGCTFIVYRNNFIGVKVNADKTAAAWSKANYPIYALNEHSQASIFYDNDEFIISTPDNSPIDSKIKDINFTNGAKKQNGSTIIDNQDGTFTVKFGSIFYDTIEIMVTYDGGIESMTLNRVGLYINWSGHHTDVYSVYHGTDSYSDYDSNGHSAIVYASFYYDQEPTKRSDLFVTLTHPDGTKETKIVSPVNDSIINDNNLQGDSKYVDDYMIWAGDDFNDIPKVEAIVCTDVFNENTFGGVQLGSGAGVSWVCKDN